MKKDTHPNYQPIIFHDVTCNKSFLISSTLSPKETMKYEDGKEYPVYKVETSSESNTVVSFSGDSGVISGIAVLTIIGNIYHGRTIFSTKHIDGI